MTRVKLESRIPQIIANVASGVHAANRASAERIARDAKGRVARNTGALAASIEARDAEGSDMHVVADEWYAHFIEYGTSRQGARPFMTPAAESERLTHLRAILGLFK